MKKSFLIALAASCVLVSNAAAQQQSGKIDPNRKAEVHAKAAKKAEKKAATKTLAAEALNRQELRIRSRNQAKKNKANEFKLSKEQAGRQENKKRKANRTAKAANKGEKKGG